MPFERVNAVDKTEKALKRSCFKAFIWWSIAVRTADLLNAEALYQLS